MSRGLLATCYATLAPGVAAGELAAGQARAFAGEPFVDLLPAGAWPSTRAVAASNRAQVAAAVAGEDRVVAAAAIDNLVKGAAGQALQCANLALGLPETAGLDLVPPGP
jgi:N-acetyl-gamma-glutamyl-phosphate reductase